ncbi:hypothetical protein [Flavobacterium filum]|uniref:hypothetical protein n=1 Tax=Flavobacterium filum TaxID=370974 RepID=UPI0023F0C0BE|nr:hypothetical protein [Flavobacterium filum]
MEQPMTKTEFNYIQTINTLTALDEKQKEKLVEQSKLLVQKDKRIDELTVDIYNMKTEISRLKNELSTQKAIVADDRNNLLELKPYIEKARNMERELKDFERRYDNMVSIKNLAINRLEKENNDLKMERHDLKKEIEELQDEIDSIEIIDDEEEVNDTIEAEQYGGLLTAEHEQYEMPKLSNKEVEAEKIAMMVEGGEISLNEIKQVVAEKNQSNISDEDRAISFVENELKRNKGRIDEELLAKQSGVVFDKSKITFTATIKGNTKTLNLKRNYLSPTYSLQ